MNASELDRAEGVNRSATGLYAQVQRLARPGATGEAQYGAAGVAVMPPPATIVGLFELTEPIVFPHAGDPSEPDVPYTRYARLVWLAGNQDAYQAGAGSPQATLYYPAAERNAAGQPVGLIPLSAGDRCHAWFNHQSGRWEILAIPTAWRRFEMTAALDCGGSAEAMAYVYDVDGVHNDGSAPSEVITVWDAQECFSKMATAAGDTGALGIARFMPDRRRWEIVWMQTPGDFWAALDGELTQADPEVGVVVASGDVWGGYNVFQSRHGPRIMVYNPPGGGNHADFWHAGATGDRALCRWDVRGGRYWIVAIEPNAKDWHELDVVTTVTKTSDTVTVLVPGGQTNLTFVTSVHSKTRKIQLPPWASIGAEVNH